MLRSSLLTLRSPVQSLSFISLRILVSVFFSSVHFPAQIYLFYSFHMIHKKVFGFLQWLDEIRDPCPKSEI